MKPKKTTLVVKGLPGNLPPTRKSHSKPKAINEKSNDELPRRLLGAWLPDSRYKAAPE